MTVADFVEYTLDDGETTEYFEAAEGGPPTRLHGRRRDVAAGGR